jgi:hypothetical protein
MCIKLLCIWVYQIHADHNGPSFMEKSWLIHSFVRLPKSALPSSLLRAHLGSVHIPVPCTSWFRAHPGSVHTPSHYQADTIYSGNYIGNDDNDYLSTVEELLWTRLQKEGFATRDQSSEHTVRAVQVTLSASDNFTSHSDLSSLQCCNCSFKIEGMGIVSHCNFLFFYPVRDGWFSQL